MYEMQGAVCRVLFWGPMKVTLQNKTWISKSTLNQKQEKKKKKTSVRCSSLAYKYNVPLTG